MPIHKREIFKLLIQEFLESKLPAIHFRELEIPETNKIITIFGPRRVGKTFYCYSRIQTLRTHIPRERILYINFEDDRLFPLETVDLKELLEAYRELYPNTIDERVYWFLDEIQAVPGWETFIRRIHDKEQIRLFLTGSSSKLMSHEIATNLRGRTFSFALFPFSFREVLDLRGIQFDDNIQYSKKRHEIIHELEIYIEMGGYPEILISNPPLRKKILQEYYDTMISLDLVERYGIRNVHDLKLLVKFLITNIGNPFSLNSYAKMAQSGHISKSTLFEYVSHLEETRLVFLIPIFSYSLKVQQVNPRKIYCIDTGLRNAVAFKFSRDIGRLAENVVFLELKRHVEEIYYWKKQGEVDFVWQDPKGLLNAANVTFTNEIHEREMKGLEEFAEEYDGRTKHVFLISRNLEEKRGGVEIVPLWKWLLFGPFL